MNIVLTIAGSDSSGGAGVQADLKTFAAFDCFGMSVITAITAQNSLGVELVHVLPGPVVRAQLKAVVDDYQLSAVKIGMIGSPEIASLIGQGLSDLSSSSPHDLPIIVDTPLKASTGAALFEEGDEKQRGVPHDQARLIATAYREHILPHCTLFTPNLDEAALLLNGPRARSISDMKEQAGELFLISGRPVLLKGGHLMGLDNRVPREVTDVFFDGQEAHFINGPYVKMPHCHGTGCILASSIAALTGKGDDLLPAAMTAKKWLTNCLQSSSSMGFGRGSGPVNISKLTKLPD